MLMKSGAGQKLMATMRTARWHAIGGQGIPPDLSILRENCIEEIAAEFYEGEPQRQADGSTLVRFAHSLDRAFFVGELFTEYDPATQGWKTFSVQRRGDDVLSIAPCREDGTALDGNEQRTFRDLEKRSVVDYAGSAAHGRLEIHFLPPPVGEPALYALVKEVLGPRAEDGDAQGELGLNLPKRRRRGRRLLRPAPLEIPMYIKQGQHLTNQILGRERVSSKPIPIEQMPAHKLAGDVREQVVKRNIRAIGADLTASEHLAMSAFHKLLTLHGHRDRKIRIVPDHWYEAYGVPRHEHSKSGSIQYAQRAKLQAMGALVSIASRSMLISYMRRNDNQKWDVVQRITTLVRVASGYVDVEDEAAEQLQDGISLGSIEKLRVIELEFDDVFFDQVNQHYVRRPHDIEERLKLANDHRRLPDSTYNFINYLYGDGEMRRRRKQHQPDLDWKLTVSLTDLAHMLRMTDKLRNGEHRRILKEIDRIAGLTLKIGILASYDLSDDERLVFELNGRQAFPEGEERVAVIEGNRPFSLLSEVNARLAKPFLPCAEMVFAALWPDAAAAEFADKAAVARAIAQCAKRLLSLHILVPEDRFTTFLNETVEKVRGRHGIRSPDRYFITTLEDRLQAALESLSRESKSLERAAETNPQAATKLQLAQEFLTSLSQD